MCQAVTCVRESDRVSISVFSYFCEKSEDALSKVLQMAYGTHMSCVLTWRNAYCVYPWELSDGGTRLLKSSLTKRQRVELKRWIENVGGSGSASVRRESLDDVSHVRRSGWWTIRLSSSWRTLRAGS